MKTLAKYLAEYLEQELTLFMKDSDRIHEILKQGMDAYMSTEDCEIIIQPRVGDPQDCEHCRKCGENTCGNDVTNRSCFEPRK